MNSTKVKKFSTNDGHKVQTHATILSERSEMEEKITGTAQGSIAMVQGSSETGSGEQRNGSGEQRNGSGEQRNGSGEQRNGSGEQRKLMSLEET